MDEVTGVSNNMDEFLLGFNGWGEMVLYHEPCMDTIKLDNTIDRRTLADLIQIAELHNETCSE